MLESRRRRSWLVKGLQGGTKEGLKARIPVASRVLQVAYTKDTLRSFHPRLLEYTKILNAKKYVPPCTHCLFMRPSDRLVF